MDSKFLAILLIFAILAISTINGEDICESGEFVCGYPPETMWECCKIDEELCVSDSPGFFECKPKWGKQQI